MVDEVCVLPSLFLSVADLSRSFPIEVQIDNGKSNVVPTIVIHDTEIKPNDKAAPSESPATATTEEAESSNDGESVPGAMPGGPSTGIPDWYKVGWREMSGIDTIPDEEAREKRLLETFISEQYYGDWYHSAGIIVFVRVLPGGISSFANPCLRLSSHLIS